MRKKVREAGCFRRSRLTLIGSLMLFLLCFSVPAFAHKVYLYAWVEGDTVFTESYFGAGAKVKDGLIEVFDPDGKKLFEGHTNPKGECAFKIPQKTNLRIVVKAGMGHRGEYLLKAEDITGMAAPETRSKKQEEATKRKSSPEGKVDMDQIQKMVEHTLDSRLKPIARSIAKLSEKKGPGLTEILGGIGYIFGIMGLLLYFKSRKNNTRQDRQD